MRHIVHLVVGPRLVLSLVLPLRLKQVEAAVPRAVPVHVDVVHHVQKAAASHRLAHVARGGAGRQVSVAPGDEDQTPNVSCGIDIETSKPTWEHLNTYGWETPHVENRNHMVMHFMWKIFHVVITTQIG